MSASSHYPGFDYPANQIFKFLAALDFFTIILQNGEIVHYKASDEDAFRQWLTANNIPDVRTEDGWVINQNSQPFYFVPLNELSFSLNSVSPAFVKQSSAKAFNS